VWNVEPASEGTGVTSESDLPCTDRTQTTKGIHASRPRALVWLMMVRLGDELEGRLCQGDGAWEVEILYCDAARRGSAPTRTR
jgi:hypothetical protein